MQLTKTGYLAYKHCPKHFWLMEYKREQATPPDAATQRRMRVGQAVDVRAQTLFPEGVLIPRRPDSLAMAALTAEVIADGATTLFQATFAVDDLLVKVDVLQKTAVGWHLTEVKSSTQYKEAEHLSDVAFQCYVLQQAGLTVSDVSLMHLNRACTTPDCPDLFVAVDVKTAVDAFLPTVMADVAVMRELVSTYNEPTTPIARRCVKPEKCPFHRHCWQAVTDWTIYEVPYLKRPLLEQLEAEGMRYVSEIPTTFNLRHKSATAFVQRMQQKRVNVNQARIRAALAELVYPLYFFDFETIDEAMPRFEGCRPYQQVPFQYSCHVLAADGRLTHYDYLHTTTSDPRRELVEALLTHIGEVGHIIAYNIPFERGVLRHLATQFPEHEPRLTGIVDRLWDQLPIFRNFYQHYGFGDSFSLKSVLPVLVPELSYKGLAVQNGAQAQVVWQEMIACADVALKQQLITQLRDYCYLDTLAMVELHRVLGRV